MKCRECLQLFFPQRPHWHLLSANTSRAGSDDSQGQFIRFPLLPAELRFEIWRRAWQAAHPARDREVCFLSITHPEPRRPGPPIARVVGPPRNRALLATSVEARRIALACGPRPYDPARDLLYVTAADFDTFVGEICGRGAEPWVATIRHIAIPLSVASVGRWPRLAFYKLITLESVSVVYPQSGGVVDCRAEVAAPGSCSTLRLLSEAERAALVIEADYSADMPLLPEGFIMVQWKRNVDEHLEMLESRMNRQCSCRHLGLGQTPPTWDYDIGGLNFRYEARCFV